MSILDSSKRVSKRNPSFDFENTEDLMIDYKNVKNQRDLYKSLIEKYEKMFSEKSIEQSKLDEVTSTTNINRRSPIKKKSSIFRISSESNNIEFSSNKSISALFVSSVLQIGLLDIIFSLDSVITAVGMVDEISVMIAAVLASVVIMLIAAKPIGDFVHRHPSIKVLALSFLTVVGVVLIAEGMGMHIPKGYVYVAMAFSLSVELLNIRSREKKKKLQ